MSISNVPPVSVEHHGREYTVTALGAFMEYLAIRYASSWLAWFAGILFWLAFYEYTKRWLSSKSNWFRCGIPTLVAILIGTGTFAVTRMNPAPALVATAGQKSQGPPVASQNVPNVETSPPPDGRSTFSVKTAQHPEPKDTTKAEVSHPSVPPQVQVNAPGGIAIGRDNNGSATVNNYGNLPDVPEAGKTPTITICVSEAAVSGPNHYFPGDSFETTITLQTDMPITRPTYGFLFDEEVGVGDVAAFGLSTTPYFNKLKLVGHEDRSFVLKLLTVDFPGGSDRWMPGVTLGAKVPSREKVNIQSMFSWFGKDQTSLSERLNHYCDSGSAAMIVPTQQPTPPPVGLF